MTEISQPDGARLRLARQARGLSRRRLAGVAGVTRQAVPRHIAQASLGREAFGLHALVMRLDQIGDRVMADAPARPFAANKASISAGGRPPRNGNLPSSPAYSALARAFWLGVINTVGSNWLSITASRPARP